jgi:hypothetical protein
LHISSISAFRQSNSMKDCIPGTRQAFSYQKARIHTTIRLIYGGLMALHGLNIPHIALVLEPEFVQFGSKIVQRMRYSRPSLGLRCLLKLRCLRISFAGSWLAFGHACVARTELVPRARGTSPHSCCGGQARDGKSRENEEPYPGKPPNLLLRWRFGHWYGCFNLTAV